MRTTEVTVMRVYITEGEGQLNKLITFLKQQEEVRGLTVFRGISGFGPSGTVHVSSLTDLSLDLPLVIEMFDEPGKMQRIMNHLSKMLKPGHIVTWSGKINVDGIN